VPNDEAETLIALQKSCEDVDYADGDWVHGIIYLCRALLENHRCGDDDAA
jgi:hypothetical protein